MAKPRNTDADEQEYEVVRLPNRNRTRAEARRRAKEMSFAELRQTAEILGVDAGGKNKAQLANAVQKAGGGA